MEINRNINKKENYKSQPYPFKLVINNKVYTEEIDLANQFNQHFVNVGPLIFG